MSAKNNLLSLFLLYVLVFQCFIRIISGKYKRYNGVAYEFKRPVFYVGRSVQLKALLRYFYCSTFAP